jgi:hypothetical protein
MKPSRVIGVDADWMKMARLQELLVTNEARMARLRRQLEEMAILLETGVKEEEPASPEPPTSGG